MLRANVIWTIPARTKNSASQCRLPTARQILLPVQPGTGARLCEPQHSVTAWTHRAERIEQMHRCGSEPCSDLYRGLGTPRISGVFFTKYSSQWSVKSSAML